MKKIKNTFVFSNPDGSVELAAGKHEIPTNYNWAELGFEPKEVNKESWKLVNGRLIDGSTGKFVEPSK
jgi:hypothetical protein